MPWIVFRGLLSPGRSTGGLRDILVAFAKDRMDRYRSRLAETLRSAVRKWPERLDAVRIVTDLALTLWDGTVSQLDEMAFWRYRHSDSGFSALSPTAVVALVKCFVLEWSIDLDYQMYHDFPLEIYLG